MPTIEEVIAEYQELKTKKKLTEDKLKEALGPTVQRMDKIKAVLKEFLQKQGADNTSTPAGTAYLTTKTSTTVKDKAAFFDYCNEGDNWEFADIRASKTNIMAQLEKTGEVPAGVSINQFIDVNIRKGK
jgi:hypothetical protein